MSSTRTRWNSRQSHVREDKPRFGSIFTPSAETVTGASILSADTVKRIQTAGNPAAYAGGHVGGLVTQTFSDDAGEMSNTYMWDAVMADGDIFNGGGAGQGLLGSQKR